MSLKITQICVRRPVFTWMLMLSVIFTGGLCYRQMGIGLMPDVDFPYVNVNVTYDGAAPEVMEQDVVDPLESALLSIEGIKSISSSSKRGTAKVSVEFDLDKNVDVAVQEVQTKIAQVQRRLPTDIDTPVVSKNNPEDRPILWISLTSEKMSGRELMLFVRDQMKERFQALAGVADVTLSGYREPNVRVWVKPEALQYYQLTALDVVQAIVAEHKEVPAGLWEGPLQEQGLRVMGEAHTLEELRQIPINSRGGRPIYTPLHLQDVATVEEGLDDARRLSRVQGVPAVGLGITKMRGTNAVEVAKRVKEKMQELSLALPAGMQMNVTYDGTTFIEESVHELAFTLILSVVMTALVCWIFLGSLGATLNIVLSIPTAIIGTFIVMRLLGLTFNSFTLLALILVAGLVVDDNIMVLENITRWQGKVKSSLQAALQGTGEVTFAAIAAAVAIVAIFFPVGMMDGVIGKYFFQFAMTMSAAVLISMGDALTLTPMRAATFLRMPQHGGDGDHGKHGEHGEHRTYFMDRMMDRLAQWYGKSLDKALDWRWSILLGSMLFCVATFFGVKSIKKEFAPAQEQGQLSLRLSTDPSSSLEYTNKKTLEVEKILQQRPEVLRYLVSLGGQGGNESNSGNFFVTLHPRERRPASPLTGKVLSQQQLAVEMRDVFKQLQGVKVQVMDPSLEQMGGKRGFPVEFNLQGNDWEQLTKLAKQIAKKWEDSGAFSDVDTSAKGKIPELHVLPLRNEARLRGVALEDLGQVVQVMMNGKVAGKFSQNGRRFDIKVKGEEEKFKGEKVPQAVSHLQVRNNRGELVEVQNIAQQVEQQGVLSISREDRKRSVSVYANLSAGTSQATAILQAKELAAPLLPAGYTFTETGNAKTMNESFANLTVVLLVGLVVAYMILAAQFESWIMPIIVLMALPLGISGSILSLLWTGQSLNVFSMIGIILLMGIVKKNSIILVDYTNQLRDSLWQELLAAGRAEDGDWKKTRSSLLRQSLLQACPIRLRPILMTSLATIAGILPAALALGPGAESRIPMATTVLGGVVVSTFLTLYVVPCFYLLVVRGVRKKEEEN